jgi:prophage regulatory protein
MRLAGLSRSTVYALIKAESFPKPVKIGGGKINGWLASEIARWQAARVAARDASR